jgi:hypothetical protein
MSAGALFGIIFYPGAALEILILIPNIFRLEDLD